MDVFNNLTEVFNNLSQIVECDEFGHMKEKVTGCKIEESRESGAFFVTKQSLSWEGEVKERKFVLPKDMSPEEYLSIEKSTEEVGLGLLLAIKEEIRATCKSVSEILTKARDAFTHDKRVYAAAVSAGGWDRTKFSNFCARSEEEFAVRKSFRGLAS